MAKRSKSSQRWLERQNRDHFAREATKRGKVSRAHFKLEQLQERFKLLKPASRVLELGAAPGGWTQYLETVVTAGKLIAVDPQPIAAAKKTQVIQGLYGESDVDQALAASIRQHSLDLVLSDMAPNMSGIRTTDQAQAMALAELALEAATRWLKPNGGLVVKVFQGDGIDAWITETRALFGKFRLVKPAASRPGSREVYAVGLEFRGSE